MNLDYLRTFLMIVQMGNFSEVARELSISQPAVSFQIRRLERDLGVRLLDRHMKKASVTEAGKRLVKFAEKIEKERAQLFSDIDQLRDEVTGDLIIAASTIPGEFLLPSILSEFKQGYPSIGVQVAISDSTNVMNGVKSGEYEIGFCGVAPEGSDLECFKMAQDEIVLIVPAGHPFVKKKKVAFTEITGEPIISREESSGTRRTLEKLLLDGGYDAKQFEPKLVLSTSQSIVSAVEEGIGIAFVSSLAIKKSLALDLVKEMEIEGLNLSRAFFCVYRKEHIVSRLLDEFISFVRAQSVG
ncbi:selenium metabolism-associated LysR family transcriptional regulator [Chloroflexota bacterium]